MTTPHPTAITFPFGDIVFVALPEQHADAIEHVLTEGFRPCDAPGGRELDLAGVRWRWFTNARESE